MRSRQTLRTTTQGDEPRMTHNTANELTAERRRNYPPMDKFGRYGLYCKHCGTVLYVPKEFAEVTRDRLCPICTYHADGITSLRWIVNDSEWQPEGDGF